MKPSFCSRLAAAALALAAPASAAAQDDTDSSWATDPVHVYYDGGDCGTDAIELQVFDREDGAWRPHPHHVRVPVPSCQIEDAGVLLNELRWRCAIEPEPEFPSVWRIFRVWDPDVMSRCAVDEITTGPARIAIDVTSLGDGVAVAATEPVVPLAGSVLVDGRAGDGYDVVLIVARASREVLAAQTLAMRAWVRRMAPRLGAIRIAVVSYPDVPGPGGRSGARRELDWSDDSAAIDAALAGVLRRPVSSVATAPEALDTALALLAAGRPDARPTIVLGLDGSRVDAATEPAPDDPLLRAAARVAARGAALHWVALGGVASDDPALVRRALRSTRGTFRRVPPQAYDTSFLAGLSLPAAEAVWVETAADPELTATLEGEGRFRVRIPVQRGLNPIVIRARTREGEEIARPFDLVFDDSMVLESILEAERARIREAQRKRLEIRPETGAREPGDR